ncbi:MAG: phospho-N-acetylmuramoyl-pentapeptide-transferase [Oscillospiraceae bacterium]|nr:phospho-N-acetylmuramoyl-pentapeptide-transferase [Oscillospiraceae bacterium]
MQRMVWAVLIAFAAALAIGPWGIRQLRRLKLGQAVYELAPESHQKKQGIPSMGGLLFAAIALVLGFALHIGGFDIAGDMTLALAAFSVLNLLIGFLDDYKKIKAKRNQAGLTERQKIAAQFVISVAFSAYCYLHPQVGSIIYVPFLGIEWDLGWAYMPAMVFVIICTTNGANLLDGLDGLLASVSSVITAFFALLMLLYAAALNGAAQENLLNMGILLAAVCGALLGYLRFNLSPAQVFMGDSGSMFLGGLVVGAAMLTRLPLILPIAAGAYAVSLLSVFLQRMYFKATHGKRIFKMSPLHHHFELSGVPEPRIVSMYAIVTVLLCLLAFLGVQ